MGEGNIGEAYLCRRCLYAQEAPGLCPNDGLKLITCHVGDLEDPCRRPLMDSEGRILTRAPLWWLNQSVAELIQFLEKKQ